VKKNHRRISTAHAHADVNNALRRRRQAHRALVRDYALHPAQLSSHRLVHERARMRLLNLLGGDAHTSVGDSRGFIAYQGVFAEAHDSRRRRQVSSPRAWVYAKQPAKLAVESASRRARAGCASEPVRG
jgi:hypothetical protein